jgi:hypothetical protein
VNKSDLVPLLEAAREIGITPNTMRRRLDRVGVQTQSDPLDRRYRLIPRESLSDLVGRTDPRSNESAPPEAASVA